MILTYNKIVLCINYLNILKRSCFAQKSYIKYKIKIYFFILSFFLIFKHVQLSIRQMIVMKKFLIISILLISITNSAQSFSKKDNHDPLEKQKTAPDTLEINKQKLVLNTYLWRDFMPISPPDGKPLKAIIKIVPINTEKIPLDIDASKIWVFFKKEVWTTNLNPVGNKPPNKAMPFLEKIADGGPKWGPSVEVLVVVQIRDEEGNTFLLKADKQQIHRTD